MIKVISPYISEGSGLKQVFNIHNTAQRGESPLTSVRGAD